MGNVQPSQTSGSTAPSTSTSAPSIPPPSSVGIRRNLMSLSAAEITRLQVCFYRMQRSGDWQLCAGVHGGGLPSVAEVKLDLNKSWCHHRKITFPIWHRPYLWEFEQMMQKHDPNPERGRLMLPYWDWYTPGQDHTIPAFCSVPRVQLPINGTLQTVANPLASGPSRESVRTRNGARTHRGEFDYQAVQEASIDAYNALQEDNYQEFATQPSPVSIENAHDIIHVAVGGDGDMSDVGKAAFDPMFWFHHNNVERLLYSFQVINPRLAAPRMDTQILSPFPPRYMHGKSLWSWGNNTGKNSVATEWWDIHSLDYKFDVLANVPDRGNQLRDRSRFVVFWDVPHPMQTVQIHVFITRKGEKVVHPIDEKKDLTRAGTIVIFSFNRNTTEGYCDECNTQPDIAYTLDVTNFLDNMHLRTKEETLAQVDITVRITDAGGSQVDEMATFKKPFPKADLLWENEFFADSIDFTKVQDLTQRDVQKVRNFLQYFGYVAGGGSKNLNDALRKFQQANGLEPNGLLDEQTQKLISKPRSANSDLDDTTKPVLLSLIVKGVYELHYTVQDVDEDLVDTSQPDLGLSKLLAVLEKSLKAWTDPLSERIGHKITFVYVDHSVPKVDLVFDWNTFDGVGGTLGFANSQPEFGSCAIELDRAERWVLDGSQPHSLQPVVTHELGHLFGLHHTMKEDSIMNPYYRPNFLTPTAKDIDEVVRLYHEAKKAH